ncbi:MAG: phage tail tube protein [Deltaproteobacteria bacterium]|nr:phage tail tube protein [Deltaproteobacteria bacterium]
MADNRIYLALGEEAARGVKESTTVGFIPLLNPGIPRLEFDERKRAEFRGEDARKGFSSVSRMGRRWGGSIEMPFFTEAGGTKGMAGSLLKHFFGSAASAENAATGQYHHMMSPVADPFAPVNLGDKALTLNLNINEGAAMSNWPFAGGRVKSLSFEQEAGSPLKLSAELFGQKREAVTAEIGGAAFAAENLRCDYNNLKVYTGVITRTGTAPDYTGFAFGSATQIKPDRISVKVDNGMEDALRLAGVDYPDKTRLGQFKVTAELTIDWEDPASGFSSVSEFNDWAASGGSTNLFLHWDTGTQAGTGDNHGLYIDLPVMRRLGGEPDYGLDKDPMITLKYEGLFDAATTQYMIGVMLKNTAPAI